MNENVIFFLKFKRDLQFYYDTLPLMEAIELMKKHKFTAVPVIDRFGEYAGTVSEGDFLWYILAHGNEKDVLENAVVKDVIRPDFMPAVNIAVTMPELIEKSFHQNFVPVVDDRNVFIGIVTRQALLRFYGRPIDQNDLQAPLFEENDKAQNPVHLIS